MIATCSTSGDTEIRTAPTSDISHLGNLAGAWPVAVHDDVLCVAHIFDARSKEVAY